jgi:hypothetical protein
MRVSCVPARTLQPTYKPHAAQDIPEDFFGGGEWPRQIIGSTDSNQRQGNLPSTAQQHYGANVRKRSESGMLPIPDSPQQLQA